MDFQTMIIIGAIVLLIAYLVNRNRSDQNQQRPTYNDPNVQGRGGFGRDRTNQVPENRQSNSNSESINPSSRNDDSNVQGQGGFGRNKP